MSTKTLTFSKTVHASPAVLYRAFTNAQGLQEWFGDVVEADARPGGRIYVWWNQGYYTAGLFSHLEQERKVEFSWRGLGEPALTHVKILLEADGDASKVTLFHEDVPEGGAEGFEHEWPLALENLKSVLETGVDKRLYDRPMLGFFIGGLVDENLKTRLHLPVETGMHVAGVIDGMGAQKSGLKADDVIFSVDGVEITTFDSIRPIVSKHKGGDVVETIVYRGAEKIVLPVELSKRPVPAAPAPPADLAREGHAAFSEALTKLDEVLEGVTEEEACHKASPGEWSVKEVLAHLLIGERWGQFSWALVQTGNKFPDFPGQPLISALAQTYTLADLRTELRHSAQVELAQIAALPETFTAQKGLYFLAGNDFAQGVRNHFLEHTAQIQTALEAARKK
ncbi:MAG TPA: SRPBCC domain-containing protein [Anaerolineales bacterium]|nr:SRPBCC domain-containing protein [Anaerolineales bacterium]